MFLYVEQVRGLEDVPCELLAQFGEPQWVLDVELTENRRLAVEDPTKVMKNIREKGFHLQFPPGKHPESVS